MRRPETARRAAGGVGQGLEVQVQGLDPGQELRPRVALDGQQGMGFDLPESVDDGGSIFGDLALRVAHSVKSFESHRQYHHAGVVVDGVFFRYLPP
jgi:hypothetical protein